MAKDRKNVREWLRDLADRVREWADLLVPPPEPVLVPVRRPRRRS